MLVSMPFSKEKGSTVSVRASTGAAWPSSARGVNRILKWHNERNPRGVLHVSHLTAGFKPEEGGDDVRSAWPLCPGLHTCYNGGYKELRTREGEPISKKPPQFGLQAETRLHEAGIASNRVSG